jgi:hypothetical protein
MWTYCIHHGLPCYHHYCNADVTTLVARFLVNTMVNWYAEQCMYNAYWSPSLRSPFCIMNSVQSTGLKFELATIYNWMTL